MRYFSYVISALLLAGFLYGLYAVFTYTPRGQAKPLPNGVLEDQNGNPIALRELVNGKVAVVNVWASWCPYCISELPDFARLKQAYPDVAIIAVNRKESQKEAQAYLREHGISDALTILFDEYDDFYRAINGVGMPETVIVNTEGYIVVHRHGPMTFDEMERAVQQVRDR